MVVYDWGVVGVAWLRRCWRRRQQVCVGVLVFLCFCVLCVVCVKTAEEVLEAAAGVGVGVLYI